MMVYYVECVFQVLEDGSLYIRKVAGKKFNTTEGQYSCFVRNKFGALLSNPAQLRIASEYDQLIYSYIYC